MNEIRKFLNVCSLMAVMAGCPATATEGMTQFTGSMNETSFSKQKVVVSDGLMTPEVLWAMGRIGSHAASPDGKHVAYQVDYYSVEGNKKQSMVVVEDPPKSSLNREDLRMQVEGTEPAWLDEGTVAFVREGEIWAIKVDGSGQRQLSRTGGKVEGFKFSPDKRAVVIVRSVPFHEVIEARPGDLPKTTGLVVKDLMYRHWDHYVESIQHPFIYNVGEGWTVAESGKDILEGEPYECPMEPFGGIEQLDWSPDSKTVAYTCRRKTGLEYSISTDSDIYLYDVESGMTRNLCKPAGYKSPKCDPTRSLKFQAVNAAENLKNNVGYDMNPQFSPDGQYIAWLSMERDGYEADLKRLCICEVESGKKQYVDWKSDVEAFCWGGDPPKSSLFREDLRLAVRGERLAPGVIYFLSVWEGCCNMYVVDEKGKVEQLTESWDDWTSVQMANDGKRILAARQSMSSPTDLYLVTPQKRGKKGMAKVEQITHENEHILSQLKMGKVEQYWVATTDGKKELVWVVLPANYEKGKKYPTLLFCEGGPQSPVSQFWSYRWNFQIMAANGYVIVAPNRHGLPGFGQEWKEQISGDWTGQCMQDYLSAIDFAADSLPYVDKDRLAAVGASFGGFSVYYLAGIHEKRFKAFISHDGAFNLEAMYLETEENWFSNWEYDEAFWHSPQMANAKKTYEHSPHRMVDKWDTPILCIHGEKDYRICYTQGMQAFNAARMRGLDAELLLFPDENHWVLKPQNGILWQRRFFKFLERNLK